MGAIGSDRKFRNGLAEKTHLPHLNTIAAHRRAERQAVAPPESDVRWNQKLLDLPIGGGRRRNHRREGDEVGPVIGASYNDAARTTLREREVVSSADQLKTFEQSRADDGNEIDDGLAAGDGSNFELVSVIELTK